MVVADCNPNLKHFLVCEDGASQGHCPTSRSDSELLEIYFTKEVDNVHTVRIALTCPTINRESLVVAHRTFILNPQNAQY